MRLFEVSRLSLATLLSASLLVSACGDDDASNTVDADVAPSTGSDAAAPDGGAHADSASPGAAPEGGSTAADAAVRADAAASDASAPADSSTPAADASASDAATDAATSMFPALPKVLSLSGCASVGVPALCSLTQTGGNFTANCGGLSYTGTVAVDRAVQMAGPEVTENNGAKSKVACSGKFENAGHLALDCARTTTGGPDAGTPGVTMCTMRSDSQILPGVACMELPAQFDDVSVCKEGAAMGGTTFAAGTCKVVQDGCAFQAECENDVTLSGTVTQTGMRFTRRLKALADAAMPATGMPAFMKGAETNHTCTGTVADGKLMGFCTAGGVRGGMPTSVCALEGTATLPASCGLLGPTREQLFVLDSCDLLKNGEGQIPGIGEPVCAIRQTNCIWDIQCGRDPLTKFSGRLAPGSRKVEWRLATGTPCELTIDAAGAISGKCTVAGQAACELKSKAPVPGGANCAVLPGGTNVKSHGCGGGDPLLCRGTMQHGCNYMGLCKFTDSNPDLLVAGQTSTDAGRDVFKFQGLGEYTCSVTKATEAEVASGDRLAYEWYGQCVTPEGGMCRDNYDPATKSGFRGLRVYFDVPAGVTVPPPPVMTTTRAPE